MSLKVNDYVGSKRGVGLFGLPQGSVLSPLLFIIYVSDLLHNIHLKGNNSASASLFKYADDGTVMVTAETTSECYSIMQSICQELTEWCKNWFLAVNCSRNKTEAILVTSRSSHSTVLGKLTISGEEIQYVKKSKVLGIVIDEDLTFESHAKTTLKACWFKWNTLTNHTTRKRGLNCSSLSILFKTAVLTKLLYAAPVWLERNLKIFKGFMFKAIFKISGSQFYPAKSVLEVMFSILPLELSLEIMTIKFILKSLSEDAELKAVLLQIEETYDHMFFKHVVLAKNYLAWKQEEQCSARSISLLDVNHDDLIYSKQNMDMFTCSKWNRLICTNEGKYLISNNDSTNVDSELVNTYQVMLKSPPMFFRSDRRTDDTNLVDFMHGHSLRFLSFRYTTGHSDNRLCMDCKRDEDTPEHKLFYCSSFSGKERDALIEKISTDDSCNYRLRFIFSADMVLKQALRDMVRLICRDSCTSDLYCGSPSV